VAPISEHQAKSLSSKDFFIFETFVIINRLIVCNVGQIQPMNYIGYVALCKVNETIITTRNSGVTRFRRV